MMNESKGANMNYKQFNQGDKVKTVYGNIETVMVQRGCEVITFESARENSHYHPSKVWLVK